MERPGQVDEVEGEVPDEGEKDDGGWVVDETQRKTQKDLSVLAGEESRMGRLKRLFPTLLSPPAAFSLEALAHQVDRYGEKSLLRYQEWEKEQRLQRQNR